MMLIVDNLRLRELVAITELNRPVYEHFVGFLLQRGYQHLSDFVADPDKEAGYKTLVDYFETAFPDGLCLYDGIARPYTEAKGKWLFIGWIFRDAPEQRLKPMLGQYGGASSIPAQAAILNDVRVFVAACLPERDRWEWIPIAEVIADRLEGSRRAIKGTLLEVLVRRVLNDLFAQYQLDLTVVEKETKIGGETYDVRIIGTNGSILMPVKSRETMGGGHAHLFTRDIYKSISVANAAGFQCIPVVVAESWLGDLEELKSEAYVHISANPNQIVEIEDTLRTELEGHVAIFSKIA